MSPELWELPRPKSLTTFQGILTLIGDLRRTRTLIEEAATALQAEYATTFPTLRLVLYLKGGIYLYWGHFMTSGSVDRVFLGPGSRPRAWIRQLGTDLTGDMIARFGEAARSAELLEFDRRAAALRRARKELTRAEQSVRMTLAHWDKHRLERASLPVLPNETRSEIPADFRKYLGYAWRLSLDAEGVERRMAALVERYKSRRNSRALALKIIRSYSHIPDTARWLLRGRLLSDTSDRLSHRFLWELLRLSRRSRDIILDFDRARWRILRELIGFERIYHSITGVGRSAIDAAERSLLDSCSANKVQSLPEQSAKDRVAACGRRLDRPSDVRAARCQTLDHRVG